MPRQLPLFELPPPVAVVRDVAGATSASPAEPESVGYLVARQMTVFDIRSEDGEPAFEFPGEVKPEPQSVCSIVEQTGGNALSGHQRAVATDDVEAAVWRFMTHAATIFGWGAAAKLLLHMVARDPYFQPYAWMVELFREHRRELTEQFARTSEHDRQTDYSEGNSDE